jgi:gliding motility-associated-like protein
MVVGHEPGGGAAMTLYTINLQPPYYAGLASIISDEPVRITDIAYDPIFGSLVGFDEIKKRLVKVTMGGLVTSINYAQQLQLNSLDALFFDRWGLLYGHDGAGGQGLKLFNKFDGRVQKSFYGPAGSNGDGCSCPYRLRFFKQITPQLVVPCSEILVTYHLYNTAGIAHGQKTLVDEFPPDFTISEIVRKPYSTVVSGVGTNLLELQGMEVLLGWDSLVVRVDVGSLSGEYAGQAVAGGFPLSLGTELYSDNPNTSLPNDPTPITVADTGQVILQKMPTICPGTSTPLTAAANGISYRWSNGSVQSSIAASEPGLYWVEVEGACGTYRDSVWVEMAPQAWIDLGENIEVPYAQQLRLDFSTNAGPGASFFWQASGTALDCSTCPNPSATITGPAVFSVTLTDENGCTATDKVSVSVKEARSIYFPNVFSPNDDGINDLFYPQADGAYPLLSLRVYDRWGGLVFEKMEGTVNDPAAGWNGRAAKGGAAAAGLYRWEALIDYGNGIHRPFTGNVLVVR